MTDTSIRRRAAFFEQTTEFNISPEQIRLLNTIPVDLVVPANAQTFIEPRQIYFIGKLGTTAYSTNPSPSLIYSDATAIADLDGDSWDGSAAVFSVLPVALGVSTPNAQEWTDQIGKTLQLSSSGDVTGGDAPMTVIVTYRSYDLTGLLS